METNEKLMAVLRGVRNENSVMRNRIERVMLENRALRGMTTADTLAEVQPGAPTTE
jgi:hypothetical protein